MGQARISSFVAILAKLYSRSPVRPFQSSLRRRYRTYLQQAGDAGHVVHQIDGIRFELDLRESIDRAMYYGGSREPDTSRALRELCHVGDIVFDVGANVGSHTLPMAKAVGPAGHVFAFEPVPWALDRMRKNLALNDFKNIHVQPLALGDEASVGTPMRLRASFRLDARSGCDAQGQIDSSWWEACEDVIVPVETIDGFVESNSIARLDVIKLDVDGFEGKVLRGASKTLRELGPSIVMEIAPAWTAMRGDSMNDIVDGLEAVGYSFFREEDYGRITDIRALIAGIAPDAGFNVIAAKSVEGDVLDPSAS